MNTATAQAIAEHARRILATAPPLTGERRERVINLMRAGASK